MPYLAYQNAGSQERTVKASCSSDQEQGDDGNDGRKSSVAGDKIIGNDGNEPFSRRIYNPASGNSGGIASETHAHSKGLFPAGRAFLKTPVKIKRYSRQITEILQ